MPLIFVLRIVIFLQIKVTVTKYANYFAEVEVNKIFQDITITITMSVSGSTTVTKHHIQIWIWKFVTTTVNSHKTHFNLFSSVKEVYGFYALEEF